MDGARGWCQWGRRFREKQPATRNRCLALALYSLLGGERKVAFHSGARASFLDGLFIGPDSLRGNDDRDSFVRLPGSSKEQKGRKD